MAFDQSTRNRLQRFVSDARDLLTEEFTRQLQHDYGIDPVTCEVADLDKLTHLDDFRIETARLLRNALDHYLTTDSSNNKKEVLERIIREQAFTVLNRIAALRMAEARGFIIESIEKGYQSKGFQLYTHLAVTGLGEKGDAYCCYLYSLFDELALDLHVLFDRFSIQGRLFPKESVLLQLLGHINHPDLENVWTEDETIGWIYQYFNSAEERKQMRAESSAPRNSRELAVRNQFFTPRYVVEFLTDNTLGRLWYEMSCGNTSLKDTCRYLVQRPNEVFLAMGEDAPEQNESGNDISQEELLKQPLYIPFRPRKDPREIKMLDPACGSMHFGLYAFDLFEQIYEEAWDLECEYGVDTFERNSTLKQLQDSYKDKDSFLQDVPRLIIEHNIHGVDIDPRAVQISGLSLWLRAQRTWKQQHVKPIDRPQIRKSNIVCAEPMPGEKDLLQEFTERLKPRILGQLVEVVFEKMNLAGEAGCLLKIEEDIEEAIEEARESFNKEIKHREIPKQRALFSAPENPKQQSFDFADLPSKTEFWYTAEHQILDALHDYSEYVGGSDRLRLRLFTEDAAKGFAFIDLCRKRFDVVLMNPPFGDATKQLRTSLSENYTDSKFDLYACSYKAGLARLNIRSLIGAIVPRNGFLLSKAAPWRSSVVLHGNYLDSFCDLGFSVLDDALVETAMFTLQKCATINTPSFFCRLIDEQEKSIPLEVAVKGLVEERLERQIFLRNPSHFISLPSSPFAYWVPFAAILLFLKNERFESSSRSVKQGIATGDNYRFLKLRWEIPPQNLLDDFRTYAKGGEFANYFSELHLVINWNDNGKEIKANASAKYGSESRTIKNQDSYFRPGLTYTLVTVLGFSCRIMNMNCIYDMGGPAIFIAEDDHRELLGTLAFLNSRLISYLLSFITDSRHWHVFTVQRIPYPLVKTSVISELAAMARRAHDLKASLQSLSLSSALFSGHEISQHESLEFDRMLVKSRFDSAQNEISIIQSEIDKVVEGAFSLNADIFNLPASSSDLSGGIETFEILSTPGHAAEVLDFLIGLPFGRWDIRYATGEKKPPGLLYPFDPLPICPPGMLQNGNGLPAEQKDVPGDYPLRISWNGILVDDEGLQEDIIMRVSEAIKVLWGKNAGDIEQEICETFGLRNLREYFAKPASFFANHLKRYSKSRRQAPIFLPISTESGSYTLWLYYHRLTDQTLYTCVNDFVDPAIKQIIETVGLLRQKTSRTSQEENELEKCSDMELELKDFRDELLRIAKFWKPNMNDGVQITAAPLWELFRLPKWRNTLKVTWQNLESGEYDWAHLAYSIWPERVIRASHRDHSLAIAHDLEEELWDKNEDGTDRQGNIKYKWVPKNLSVDELKLIIRDKTIGH